MTLAELILTVVLSIVVFGATIYIIIMNTNTKNRLETFMIINESAIPEATVFFGDSLTEFYPLQDFFPGVNLYNRGIAGNTTKDLINRLDNVLALQPKKLFLQIGTNDLGYGKSIKKIISNIKFILHSFKQTSPHTKLYVISLYPVSHTKTPLSFLISGRRTNKSIQKINALLQTFCQEENITFINIYDTLLKGGKKLHPVYTLEGLHISGEGYRAITHVLRDYVNEA